MTSAAAPGVPFGTKLHQVAEANPDGPGIIFAAEDGSERTVTFGELDRRSTQLARVLMSRGLTVGDFMAVCLRNSPEHLVATFAGWKAGAVVVPMRWNLPDWEREPRAGGHRSPPDGRRRARGPLRGGGVGLDQSRSGGDAPAGMGDL